MGTNDLTMRRKFQRPFLTEPPNDVCLSFDDDLAYECIDNDLKCLYEFNNDRTKGTGNEPGRGFSFEPKKKKAKGIVV